jgi:hypothetical protein
VCRSFPYRIGNSGKFCVIPGIFGTFLGIWVRLGTICLFLLPSGVFYVILALFGMHLGIHGNDSGNCRQSARESEIGILENSKGRFGQALASGDLGDAAAPGRVLPEGRVPAPAPARQTDVHVQLHRDGARDGGAGVLPAQPRAVHQGAVPDPAQGRAEP